MRSQNACAKEIVREEYPLRTIGSSAQQILSHQAKQKTCVAAKPIDSWSRLPKYA
jgi:hypothetical protein